MVKVIPMEKKGENELIKNHGVAFYCRVGTLSQTDAERLKLEKKLFKSFYVSSCDLPQDMLLLW